MGRYQLEMIESQALHAVANDWCRESCPLADPDAMYILRVINHTTFENALDMVENLLGHLEVTNECGCNEVAQSYMEALAQHIEQESLKKRKKRPAPIFVPLVDRSSVARGMRSH